jgi:hypothetical protein
MAKAQTAAKRGDASFAGPSSKKTAIIGALTTQRRDIDLADILAKLQSLNDTLDQQETALSNWPDSPGKDSVAEAIKLARDLAARIARDFGEAANSDAPALGATAAPRIKVV